ncbi:MAG TPA: sugar ABC transporter substrate-binding protein [Thermoanaerobaculaceae bacterium]|nr:sugar ABC transporter substrate-binding protein [Thermoanaerobaculaceae bacterium]HRS15212.1 sugar ABC transporter substrate-binding protein [Thermoanaerobaculaceae bacterium]
MILLGGCDSGGGRGEVVRFWGLGREGEVVRELVTDFERSHPGITVVVQQIPWSAAHEQLLTAFVGGSTPDVAQVGNTWIPELAALGAVAPLDAHVAASPVVHQSDHFEGIWDTNVVDGVLCGIPWYVDTRVVFYRSDLLAAIGVTAFPRTWSAWLQAMRRLAAGGNARYAILLPTDDWTPPVILGLGRGASLLRDGDRYGHFQEPAFAEAFSFYLRMFREGLAPALANTQLANMYQQMAEGQFAMHITGPWNLGEFRRRFPPQLAHAWATAPIPAPDGAPWPGASLAGGASLVVFARSRHVGAAWRLVEYLSEPRTQLRFFELTGDLPAHRGAWDDPRLRGDPRVAAFWEQLQHARPTPKVPEWEQIATRVWRAAESAIRGQASPEQALASLDRDVDRILAKRRFLLERRKARP